MSRYVVDASVAIKWYLPEIYDVESQRLLDETNELLVPDLLYSEVGNILWKKIRAGEIQEQQGQAVLQSLNQLPLQVFPAFPLVLLALEIANQTHRTVYDSLYLALAVKENALLVTADERFYNALQSTPLASQLILVKDIS